MAVTTIQLDTGLRDRLKGIGKKGETYGDIIERLLEQAELANHLETHYLRLKEKSRFIPLDEV